MDFRSILLMLMLTFISAAPIKKAQNLTSDFIVVDDMRIENLIENRNGEPNFEKRWPHGIIPYVIDPEFTAAERAYILHQMGGFHNNSCVQWVPRSNETSYANIKLNVERHVCSSDVGRGADRSTDVLLAKDCVKISTWHELNHAVGFYHEQNRQDRDDYVTINWENVEEDKKFNYKKLPHTETFGVPYDYHSAMQYRVDPNKPAMVAKIDPNIILGSLDGEPSPLDYVKINLMYKCDGKKSLL